MRKDQMWKHIVIWNSSSEKKQLKGEWNMFSVAVHHPHPKFKGDMATTGLPPSSPGWSLSHCLSCVLHLDEHHQYSMYSRTLNFVWWEFTAHSKLAGPCGDGKRCLRPTPAILIPAGLVYGSFGSPEAALRSQGRDLMAHKAENSHSSLYPLSYVEGTVSKGTTYLLQKKFANPCTGTMNPFTSSHNCQQLPSFHHGGFMSF